MQEKISLIDENRRWRSIFIIFNTLLMSLVIVIALVPVIKVLADSFEGRPTYGFKLIPNEFTLDAYKRLFESPYMLKSFYISCFVTGVGTVLALFLTTLGAFVMTRKDMPGRQLFMYMIMFTLLFHAGLIPTFIVIKELHLIDTVWSVILPFSVTAYNLILMKNFFSDIPQSLYEAAEIDGCTPIGIFAKIIIPMSKPAIAAIGLFYFVAYWNEFFHYIIYISKHDLYNFQCVLRDLIMDSQNTSGSQFNVDMNTLKSAAIIVAIIPVTVVYPFIQRYFITGLNLGAVKE